MITLTIDGITAKVKEGATVLEAVQSAGVYIPTLCWHPDLLPFGACRLCIVEIEGVKGFPIACTMEAREGMVVHTNTPEVQRLRRELLALILSEHPHTCLTCAQREGCSLTQCSSNVPEVERCCPKFNNCELRKVAEYIGIKEDLPRYIPKTPSPVIKDEPFFIYDPSLCILCGRCVRMCQEVRGVSIPDFASRGINRTVTIAFGQTFREAGCKSCLSCIEVCPTGAMRDKEKWQEPPCRHDCPANIDIPRYIHLVAEGKFPQAIAVIREKVPFPAVLGHICPHPCEEVCRRGKLNEPISIQALERFAAEQDSGSWEANIKPHIPTGKKIAIIGSGPAGLTAGYYLAKLGHQVTVFEALPEPGGMMQVGIPEIRLPKAVVEREINHIKSAGVDIRTNTRVESIDSLFEQGYQAIFIAVGAHQDVTLGIEGESSPGVVGALSFLREVNSYKQGRSAGKVAIVGGTRIAIDAARLALRSGAKEATIYCPQAEMTVNYDQLERATEEGVKIICLTTLKKISPDEKKLKVEFMSNKTGESFTAEFDKVVLAMGQRPEIPEGWRLKVSKENTIEVDPDTLATSRKGVFAGGDVVIGPASVIEAIAMGRKAAISIDRYLGGEGIIDEQLAEPEEPDPWLGHDEGFADWHRVPTLSLPLEKRLWGFDEVKLGFNAEEAVREAKRCLRCELRGRISPVMLPPERWLRFEIQNISLLPETEGVYQLFDEEKNVIYIKGTMSLRRELIEQLETNKEARYFKWEEEPMYTKRESELIQQFLQTHGRLPPQNDELAGLF